MLRGSVKPLITRGIFFTFFTLTKSVRDRKHTHQYSIVEEMGVFKAFDSVTI